VAGRQSRRDRAVRGEFDREGARKALEKRGYEVTTVVDDDATLTNIVDALGGVSGPAPGLVIFSTHGSQRGGLLTGDDLGNWSDWDGVDAAWAKVRRRRKRSRPTSSRSRAAPRRREDVRAPRHGVREVDEPVQQRDFFVNLTPAFWRWLASHNGASTTASCSSERAPQNATPTSATPSKGEGVFRLGKP